MAHREARAGLAPNGRSPSTEEVAVASSFRASSTSADHLYWERAAESSAEVVVAVVRSVVVAIGDPKVPREVVPTPATIHTPRRILPTCRC